MVFHEGLTIDEHQDNPEGIEVGDTVMLKETLRLDNNGSFDLPAGAFLRVKEVDGNLLRVYVLREIDSVGNLSTRIVPIDKTTKISLENRASNN